MGERRRRDAETAEGLHGPKTHRRMIEQLESGQSGATRDEKVEHDRALGALDGKRRLVEDRQQHDEAEKNSERTRLFAEREQDRDAGPSDNTGNLHGVLDARGSRADYQVRDEKGLRRR